MIPDQPDLPSLLETARRVLKEEILPTAPPTCTLDLLMIVKVMEIAGRVFDDVDDHLDARQRERLGRLLGEDGDAAALVTQIRAGRWDAPDAMMRLHALLTEDARDRLARADPKYLAAVEAEESRPAK